MSRPFALALCAFCMTAIPVAAQQQAAAPVAAPVNGIAPAAEQIAGAVMALPVDMRAGATVLGYTAVGKPLVTLRQGSNDMICLPSEPTGKAFHSACYHISMEPFMARGRELRLQGITGAQVDTVRFAEVKSGKIKMPASPSMLYQVFGGTFDPATSTITGGNALYVTYIPFATPQSTGLSSKPTDKGPWIMFPGTPKAHIMFTGKMQ
jgi:hypothetical protein